MRLPRRVPWASLAELDQVCSWIYADENDLDTKVLAINRVRKTHRSTKFMSVSNFFPIPARSVEGDDLDSSCSRVSIVDPHSDRPRRVCSKLVVVSVPPTSVRHGYHTSGEWSCRSLATWRVCSFNRKHCRSAGPSLMARRVATCCHTRGLAEYRGAQGCCQRRKISPCLFLEILILTVHATQAMSWLLHHYFIPALNPSTVEPTKTPALRPLDPLLTQYKSLLKTTTRDASLRTKYKPEVTKVLRDVERWLSEAKLAANITAATLDLDDVQADDDAEDADPREWSALNQLCDHLLKKGGLVPISKK